MQALELRFGKTHRGILWFDELYFQKKKKYFNETFMKIQPRISVLSLSMNQLSTLLLYRKLRSQLNVMLIIFLSTCLMINWLRLELEWRKKKKRDDNDFSQPRQCNLDSAADDSRLRAHGWGDLGLQTLCLLIVERIAERARTPLWSGRWQLGVSERSRRTDGRTCGWRVRLLDKGRCWDVYCHR